MKRDREGGLRDRTEAMEQERKRGRSELREGAAGSVEPGEKTITKTRRVKPEKGDKGGWPERKWKSKEQTQ